MAKDSTSGRMKAVIKASPGPGLELATVDIPILGPGEILIRVAAASICGTDLHIYRWDPWSAEHIRPPVIIGHEVCGEVVEVGRDVTTVKEGDFVSVESHIICGKCVYCRTGRGHICPNTKIIGIDRNGAFAEYLAIPAENAWVNPPDMPVEVAVLQENFGNAVHTAFAVDLRAKKVLITGCGPVGLMTILVAKAIGARAVYATDVVPYRLNLALKMGADLVVNADSQDVVEVIREATEGEGVDVLLEMSGAPKAIVQGFTLLKAGGEAALLGLSSGPIPFDMNEFVIFKGIHIYGIIGRRIWETWYQMRGLIRSGLDPSQVITHRFPLEEFEKAFETMASGQSGKIVLYPRGRTG
ncbi:MAG: L-threonine 3-dehydrogenase [Armatimonadota bacterium]|nr:L-threonine 3-dehydrogenase [Armatimonadota bacterium]MDR5703173.1 L-threonine 3-dehydrogenase [Armatimonadota bacterium]